MRINERIRVPEVRLIDEEGQQVGVVNPRDALKMAKERGLDLVEISPGASPPVCKIMDYGKYLYELNKKLHEQRKHQKGTRLKEVKMRPRTDEHDYEFKKNHVLRFLEEGDKVRLVVMFRGREVEHSQLGRRKMERLIKDVAHLGAPEIFPSMEGRMLVAILAPKAQPGGKRPAKESPKEAANA